MNKVLDIKNLTKAYGKKKAVDNVSFHIEKNEVLSLLGPNGAGKTTTVNLATGLAAADGGTIEYFGRKFHPDEAYLKRFIGVVPQHNNVDRDLTIYENLAVQAKLFGLSGAKERIMRQLDFAGLTAHKDKQAGKLSGGMKRRLVIARALLHEPEIIFLDEPTVGLDVSVRRGLWDFIKHVREEQGCSVLLTTHYIEEAEKLADRVLIIDNAKLTAEGSPKELTAKAGSWAVDTFIKGVTDTEFFDTREEALQYINDNTAKASIRQANLEDAYLKVTGRRIDVR